MGISGSRVEQILSGEYTGRPLSRVEKLLMSGGIIGGDDNATKVDLLPIYTRLADNEADIAKNQLDIQDGAQSISENATKIQSLMEKVSANENGIESAGTAISTLQTAVSKNVENIESLKESKISLEKSYDATKDYSGVTILIHDNASWLATTTVPAGNAPSDSSVYWTRIAKDAPKINSGTNISIKDNPDGTQTISYDGTIIYIGETEPPDSLGVPKSKILWVEEPE